MGIDRGFDIFPPFKDTEKDRRAWAAFLDDVLASFNLDPNLHNDPSQPFISFTVGEHPRPERDAHRFRRFSSKISGPICGKPETELCIDRVLKIARKHFGRRVYAWNDFGLYCWSEVYDARRGGVGSSTNFGVQSGCSDGHIVTVISPADDDIQESATPSRKAE